MSGAEKVLLIKKPLLIKKHFWKKVREGAIDRCLSS